jgi:hypothetical protein
MVKRICQYLFPVVCQFLLISFFAFGQEAMIDVVYLKDGSIIRGLIIEQVPTKSIKIQTRDGSVFVYQIDTIEKITKERSVDLFAPEKSKPIGNAVLINPLGFLQFGPIVDLDFRVGANTQVGGQIRFSGLGILYHLVASEGYTETDEVLTSSMAVGAGVKYFFENPDSPHRLYVGGVFEYGWGGTRGSIGYTNEWEGSHQYWDLLTNVGYRWRFPSNFFVNAGILTGAANTTKSEWWFIKTPAQKKEDPKKIVFVIMAEVAFGFEF